MDIFRSLELSAGGMAAQRVRMDTIGENLANADSTQAAGGRPYRRKVVLLEAADRPSFASFLDRQGGDRAVRVVGVQPTAEPFRRVWQPGHPQAGPDGYLELPNVNPLVEMLDMLAATRAYEANATAFQASKGMVTRLLELLR